MPISFACDCGRILRTTDENAGRSAICPKCGVQLLVPAADAPFPRRPTPPLDEDAPDEESRGYDLAAEEVAPKARRGDAPYNRPRRDDRDDDDAPRRSGRPRYDDANRFIKRTPAPRRGWTDGGVAAGIGMMILGVVITVGGLAVGWIIFPGPLLFIGGIVSLVKGISSGK